MDFQCRECRAGLEQAKNASVAFRCPDHGVTELSIEHLVAGAILVERNRTVAEACPRCGGTLKLESDTPVGPCFHCDACNYGFKVAGMPVGGPERAEYGKRGGEERAQRPGPCVLPPKVSPIEEALAIQIQAAGLPEPEREYRFSPPRRWKFDFAWPDHDLAVECEGGTRQMGRHNRHQGFEADCFKYNAACRAGWKVLRYTSEMVKSGEVLRDLEEMLRDE